MHVTLILILILFASVGNAQQPNATGAVNSASFARSLAMTFRTAAWLKAVFSQSLGRTWDPPPSHKAQASRFRPNSPGPQSK